MTKNIAMLSLLGVMACSPQSETSRSNDGPPAAAAQAPAVEPVPAQENTTTKLDPAKVKAFVAYREGMIPLFEEIKKAKVMASLPKEAPPEVRAEAQKQIEEMKAMIKQMTGLVEERASFGDAVVDAMLAEQDTLGS